MIFVEKGIEQICKKMEMGIEEMYLKFLDIGMMITEAKSENNIFAVKGMELLDIEETNHEVMGQTLIFEVSSLEKQGNEALICEVTSLS